MKKIMTLTALVLLGFLAGPACVTRVVVREPVAPPPSPYPPGASAAVEMFYDDLAPHGNWVRVDGPGWVWQPASVPAGWRPYALGRWVYTDHGWTWASDESWGWAAYHYGRWHHAPRYGWVWVPGTEWGPAWVTWHSGAGWIGWAPLPWQVAWRAGGGLDWGRVDVRVAIEPAWWCFVPTRHLTDPSPVRHFAPPGRNVGLLRTTRHITHYTVVDNRVFNQGVQVNVISKAVGRPVPKIKVRHADAPGRMRGGELDGEELLVHRPGMRRGQRPGGTPGHVRGPVQDAADRQGPGRHPRSVPPAAVDPPSSEPPAETAPADGDPVDGDPAGGDPAAKRPTANRPPYGRPADRARPAVPAWRNRVGRPAAQTPAADSGSDRGKGQEAGETSPGNAPPEPPAAEAAAPRGGPAPRREAPPSQAGRPTPQSGRPAPAVSKDDADGGQAPAPPRGRPQATTPRTGKPQAGAAKAGSAAPSGKETGKKKADSKSKDKPAEETPSEDDEEDGR